MQQFVDYIIANWQWITPIVFSVVEFFILLFFKKPNVIKYIDSFYDELIELVNEAEENIGPGNGKLKFDFVVAQFISKHPNMHLPALKYAIENILSTPSKKGGK